MEPREHIMLLVALRLCQLWRHEFLRLCDEREWDMLDDYWGVELFLRGLTPAEAVEWHANSIWLASAA